MQIDFHHAVTYVAVRLGGMTHDDARIVAHAAQYVDDATTDGPLGFSSGERYVRVTSAHKTFEFKNGDQADNRLVWVPFHFLPGNAEPPAGCSGEQALHRRMMCQPDSAVARQMVHDCILTRGWPFALHRFGIALHTYVDTWAHQQFVGVICDLNHVDELKIHPDPAYAGTPVYDDLTSGATKIQSYFAGKLMPVGHAAALTCPDLPFLKWSFKRENGELVVRDNPSDFLAAATGAFNMARRYVAGDSTLPDAELPPDDRAAIDDLLRHTIVIDGEKRHPIWLEAIKRGRFSFGPAEIAYVDQGAGSWKMQALGADPDDETDVPFTFTRQFLDSDWKRFHDAVQYHRLFILHDLLPRVGLCAS